jgi:nucleolar protein 4
MAYKHDQGEKKFRGFCFIDFKEMKEADNAIKELNGKKIANRIVAVDYSLPKEKYDQIQAQGEAASKETADVQEGEDHDDMEVDGDEASGDESMDDDEVEEEVEVEKKPALRGDPGAMLFIRNLSFDSTEDELRDL